MFQASAVFRPFPCLIHSVRSLFLFHVMNSLAASACPCKLRNCVFREAQSMTLVETRHRPQLITVTQVSCQSTA